MPRTKHSADLKIMVVKKYLAGEGSLETLVIPGSVTTIGDYAFSSCDKLCKVTISNGVKQIGGGAFSNCDGLISVTFPNSVTSIGNYVFFGNDNLKNVYIPASAKIESNALTGWDNGHILYGGSRNDYSFYGDFQIHYYAKGNEVQWVVDETNDRLHCSLCGKDLAFRAPVCNFTDVSSNDYFFAPVRWAVQKNVTTGTTSTTFSPNDPCTRAQIVTFLWRAFGYPEPKSSNNPFSDVSENVYYYQPILWAVEKGITNGTGGGKFSPEDSCTRGQIVTFLYRAFA